MSALLIGACVLLSGLTDTLKARKPYDVQRNIHLQSSGVPYESFEYNALTAEDIGWLSRRMVFGSTMLGIGAMGLAIQCGRTISLRAAVIGVLGIASLGALPPLVQRDPRCLRTRMDLQHDQRISGETRARFTEAIQEDRARRSFGRAVAPFGTPGVPWFRYVHVYAAEDGGDGIVCVFEPHPSLPLEERKALCQFFRQYALASLHGLVQNRMVDPADFRGEEPSAWQNARSAWEIEMWRGQFQEGSPEHTDLGSFDRLDRSHLTGSRNSP
ncbi:MAG: hypothetical protein KIS92_13065 [Planctomycetota bacterium]|nr:hypothetical protein [Planctomycetota bacterium]